MSSTQPIMQPRSPYLRLMRLHQPVGIWLVYWPCVWAICLATLQSLHEGGDKAALLATAGLYIPLFFLGALITRSAGCIVNDMADRHLDGHVERTRTRPLASGELRISQAFTLLAVICAPALGILAVLADSLPGHVSIRDLLAITLPVAALIVAYPFMKRITWWPQAFLGITFNWGVLMAWLAVRGDITLPAWLLYAACFFWTLGYDTIYGHQDKKDDARIGIKSTSRRLEKNGKLWIAGFYATMTILLAAAAFRVGLSALATTLGIALLLVFTVVQLHRWQPDNPANCLSIFKSNVYIGLALALWLMATTWAY